MIDASPFVATLKGKPAAVLGLGISNRAVIAALVAAGAGIAAWDDDEAKRDGPCIRNFLNDDFSAFACLVAAPGILPDHPALQKARAAGIEVICDIEILHRCNHGRRVIGVTGTNGKSTTTALIGHILNQCGIPASIGGNIGRPVFDLSLPPTEGVFVLELSSYQLDLCPTFAPDIAVLLNITPDHLDHHGTMEAYINAKKNIFRGMGDAVIAVDDVICRALIKKLPIQRAAHPVSAQDDWDFDINAIASLPGLHNRQNAASARAVARLFGLNDERIYNAMKTFPGLPHRQQRAGVTGNVLWVNDSKATNADSAAKALACYDNIYWIAGGRPKEGGLKGLEPLVSRVRHVFLIGEAQDDFSAWLKIHNVPNEKCGTLDRAVDAARRMSAGQTGTVLFSPACASFDQFENFAARGDAFMTLVRSFTEKAA